MMDYRRIIFAMMCLILCWKPVFASEMNSIRELKEEVKANPRWEETYHAHGREINVNVPIIVPDVEMIPVVKASAYQAVENEQLVRDHEKLKFVADNGFLEYEENKLLPWMNGGEEEEYVPGKILISNPEKISKVGIIAQYQTPNDSEREHKVKYEFEEYYPSDIDASEVYAEDNPVSAKEAELFLEKSLNYFYPDTDNDVEIDYFEVRSRGRKVKNINDYKLGDYAENCPMGTYYMKFHQKVCKIPVFADVASRSDTTKKNYAGGTTWNNLEPVLNLRDNDFEFMDNEHFELIVTWMIENNIFEEDIPLATIDTIKTQIEEQIQMGKIRDVYALRLGYCVFVAKESPELFDLFPVWICDCNYYEDARAEYSRGPHSYGIRQTSTFAQMMFNAQTGKMYKRWLTEKEEVECPRIITWDEIR